MAEQKTPDFKKKETTYRVIIVVLILVIFFLGWQLFQTKTRVETVIVEKETQTSKLKNELETLMEDHEKVKDEYSEVSDKLTQKDSVIEAKAEEIERLIARQADYNRIKRKLEYLRNSHKRYVEQIDSLFTVNRQLKEENKDIKQKFEVSRKEKEQVSEEKDKLEKRVDMGAMLKAYNINVDAIHMGGWTGDKEKVTDKARRLDKIKICFTVSENLLAESGERTIYIRIARPDNKILYKRSEDFFKYNEEKMQYSLKKTIDYQNEKQDHCLYWEKDENVKEVMEGTYHVGIFIDGQEVGQSNMKLE
ncbi:MAG: hypothetical protein ACOCPM_00290 [Bacteroidales bacterium]